MECRFLIVLISIFASGCSGLNKPADSFYEACNYYTESPKESSPKLIMKKVDGYFKCGSTALNSYCETANCSDETLEFDEKMLAHQSELKQIFDDGAENEDLEFWLLEMREIFYWYQNNESAFTTRKYDALREVFDTGNDTYPSVRTGYSEGRVSRSSAVNSGPQVIQSQPSTLKKMCNLVRTDSGRSTGSLSLNKGSSVQGTSEPNLCTYNCTDGTTQQTTSRGSCPGRL
jgi:hypothetical protein